jgi:crotonobetainyl-CoA:carnitine CoA-transferase CaiB-like acyl-CoA transferase
VSGSERVTDRILEGVRVLDFGRYIAGPFCAALLGDLGADVIRVERIDGGEDRYLYPVGDDGDGALFLQMNRNKRGITMDPKAPGSAEILRRLVATCNVVIANLPQESLEDLGLDYPSLTAVRPDIILTAISAFGPEGPYARRVGFDGIGQAMSGAAYLSGFDRPTKSFASWVDMISASLAAFGTLAAIHEHGRTGKGQIVQGSLFGSAMTVMNLAVIEESLTGAGRQRTGNRGQSGSPADFFRTRDGWIIVQIVGDPLFRRWARLVGQPDWIEDPRFTSDALRSANGEALSERTQAWCGDLTSADALAQLEAARIPAGPILSPEDLLTDPHVRDARVLTPMDYPGLPKPAPLVMQSVGLSGNPIELWRRAPTLGEHTREVLTELGFSGAEIDAFKAAKAI